MPPSQYHDLRVWYCSSACWYCGTAICLGRARRCPYGASISDSWYRATRMLSDVRYGDSIWCYAMSGTELVYAAIRVLHDVRYGADLS
eukprot:979943-Rhodomonas_salina.3